MIWGVLSAAFSFPAKKPIGLRIEPGSPSPDIVGMRKIQQIMFRWRTAYVVDCFYQDCDFKFRMESFPMNAASDDEALAEALFFGPARNPHHWQLRAVRREGETVIYRSSGGDKPEKT